MFVMKTNTNNITMTWETAYLNRNEDHPNDPRFTSDVDFIETVSCACCNEDMTEEQHEDGHNICQGCRDYQTNEEGGTIAELIAEAYQSERVKHRSKVIYLQRRNMPVTQEQNALAVAEAIECGPYHYIKQ